MQKKTNVTNLNEGKKAPGRNGSWPETDFSIKVKKRLIDKRMTQKQLATYPISRIRNHILVL